MLKMGKSLYASMRNKPRFNVNLKATYSIKQKGVQQQCRITNLSASGAAVRLPRTEGLRNGAVISMEIPIPNTILHISAEAEIMWVKLRFNELISGIKFATILSDSMIQRLATKDPEADK
jgi:hypothetical protein